MEPVKRKRGIAGQFSLTVTDGPDAGLSFVGNEHGGPIVMVTPTGHQTFVTNPDRFGDRLNEDWVQSFIAAEV